MNCLRDNDLLPRIHAAAAAIGRRLRIMEVCGTHTHAIARAGLRSLMPENVELISGPGCPVCVTSHDDIERMVALARLREVTICTFGDMMRVPGAESSLEQERARGADVRVVYSALDALARARKEAGRAVVFLGVGFETTAPGIAAMLIEAQAMAIDNLSVYASHKRVVPAIEAVLSGEVHIDGILTPGHVSVIIGSDAYEDLAQRHRVPCVVTGFEPDDVLEGVARILDCIRGQHAGSFIQYRRAVRRGGNPRARDILMRVFRVVDAEWRGLGVIPGSGLALRPEFGAFDAVHRFAIPSAPRARSDGCRCGDVLKGLIQPPACPLFAKRCTPRTPVGPCMVSSEGSCSARYKYG